MKDGVSTHQRRSRKDARKEVSWHFRDLHGSTLSSKEQWLPWWWQTSRNTILGHMPRCRERPSEQHPYWYSEACAHTCHATLQPITKRNNIIGQQKRPWSETPRLDTNVQICQVIELHVEGKALDGVKKTRLLAAWNYPFDPRHY